MSTLSQYDIMVWDKIHIKTALETAYSWYHKEEMTVYSSNGQLQFFCQNTDLWGLFLLFEQLFLHKPNLQRFIKQNAVLTETITSSVNLTASFNSRAYIMCWSTLLYLGFFFLIPASLIGKIFFWPMNWKSQLEIQQLHLMLTLTLKKKKKKKTDLCACMCS